MSSDDDDDGWEEATGIFKAVMSSEAQNVGGSQAGSLLVGRRTRSPESDSAAAENTTFPFKKYDNFAGFPLVISSCPSFIFVQTVLFTFYLYLLSFLSHSSVCLTFSALCFVRFFTILLIIHQ